MAIYKRGSIYHVYIASPSGQRIRRSTGTSDKKLAQRFHDELKARLWREATFGERPTHSFDEAALRWLREKAHKATLRNDAQHIKFFRETFGTKTLTSITRDAVSELVDGLDISNGSRNRYVATMRAILRKCEREWGWLDRAPALRTYKEPQRRIRFLTREEAQRLLSVMPEWLRSLSEFALATGLRQGNILALEWSQIDMQRGVAWIHPDQAKARRAIGVPLNDDALAALRPQIGKHLTRVFTNAGKAIPAIESKTWQRACRKAGIKDFRFHDLRHCWASWHVQNGTPVAILQELGGWSSGAMVARYAHLAPEHLAAYAGNATFTPQGNDGSTLKRVRR
jgi:integrase